MSHEVSADGRATVLHVTNIPTPYRLPQFRAFAQALDGEGADLVIYFIGAGKRPRYWAIPDAEFDGLRVMNGPPATTALHSALGITRAIDRLHPAVIVLAWAMDPTALLVFWHCRVRSIPCIVYTGETDSAAAQRSFPAARNAFRTLFLKHADGFIAYGSRSREYLTNHGVDERLISTAINVVDTEFFRERVAQLGADGVDLIAQNKYRSEIGEPYALHLLFVGELIELKGLPLLLDALASTGRDDIALHLVGSGPQEGDLRVQCERLQLQKQVYFHGYQQKPDLPLYYAAADAFVFPSLKDVFGLVMVEAAAAGLPVIGSSMAGGTIDVVIPDTTGFIVDPHDTTRFAAAILALADDPDLRKAMGAASQQHALENLTPDVSARGYVDAVSRLIVR